MPLTPGTAARDHRRCRRARHAGAGNGAGSTARFLARSFSLRTDLFAICCQSFRAAGQQPVLSWRPPRSPPNSGAVAPAGGEAGTFGGGWSGRARHWRSQAARLAACWNWISHSLILIEKGPLGFSVWRARALAVATGFFQAPGFVQRVGGIRLSLAGRCVRFRGPLERDLRSVRPPSITT